MSIKLKGSSDGSVSFDAPADTSPSGSDITLTLPTSAGSANQFLKNSGTAGTLEYSSMVETSSGVGIGTSAPSYELDVRSSDTTTVNINAGTSNLSRLFFSDTTLARGYLNYDHSTDSLRIGSAGTERARLDSSGKLGIGVTSPAATLHLSDSNHGIAAGYVGGTLPNSAGIYTSSSSAHGQTYGSLIVQARAEYSGYGISFRSSNTERMRSASNGYFKVSNNGSYNNTSGSYHEFNQSAGAQAMIFRSTNSSYGATQVQFGVARAATSAYWFLQGISSWGSTNDTEFYIRGDGNAFADGTWSGGGADYAEYFEWSDGNTEAEDRRGISVVLDGDKIREAVADEEPIGVISGNPSVVGDADVDRWKGKYLRDDYGSYVLDEDGYRQLNSDYDSDVEYVQREDRPEWDTVGLMGKLRIRKGQVTGARWIKMRDVSDTVEEWLVR